MERDANDFMSTNEIQDLYCLPNEKRLNGQLKVETHLVREGHEGLQDISC